MKRTPIRRIIAGAALAAASASAAAAPVPGQGDWESTLQARDLDGDGHTDAYYDSTLDISWLADANVIGLADFGTANAWATGLDVAGVTGWHLPTIHIDSCGADGMGASFWNGGGVCGYDVQPSTSDMAHLYALTLGNVSYSGYTDSYGNGPGLSAPLLNNSGPFSDLQTYGYWFSLDHAVNPWSGATESDLAWRYSFYAGRQDPLAKTELLFAWAVHDGDVGVVAAVPEPQSYALMLAGLALVGAASRRRKTA